MKISFLIRKNQIETKMLVSRILLNKITAFMSVLTFEIWLFLKLGKFNEVMPFWNDNINITLPYRVFLSNAISSGTYPFYDFFSGSGVPFLSVYTSSGLSPISVGLASLFEYSSTILIYELILLNTITFTGMYFWSKKLANETVALIAALAFSLSTYFIFQSKANVEGMGSAAAIPWVCLGLLNISKAKLVGAFQIAGAGGLAFTHGYLGLNLMIFVFVSLGLVLFASIHLITKKNLSIYSISVAARRPLLIAGLGLTLFVGTIFPLLTETVRNFSAEIYLEREVNPFTASMKIGSWQTLFDPLVVRSSGPDEFGGFFSNLFIPAPLLLGLFSFVLVGLRISIPAILLLSVSYTSLLPENFPAARFLVEILPGFDLIRFHSWASIFIIFLFLTYGLVGFNNLLIKKLTNLNLIVFIFISALIISLQYIISETQKYFYITSAIFLLAFIAIFLFQKDHKFPSHLLSVLLVSLVVTSFAQMTLADRRVGTAQPFSTSEQSDLANLAVAGKATWPIYQVQREGVFSVLGSYPNELVANQHLYFNQPVAISYTPSMNKRVLDANLSRGLQTLRPFLVNTNFESLNYDATFLSPNKVKFDLALKDKTQAIIQLTYSKNFVITVDGQIRPIGKTSDDFMTVLLADTDSELILEYKPKFQFLQLLLVVLSWLSIGFGIAFTKLRSSK